MSQEWTAEEYRPNGDGAVIKADVDGVFLNLKHMARMFTPTQARMIAENLVRGAAEAEARGAKDWMEW